MINTYFESDLHRILKNKYAKDFNGKTEQQIDTYICDVLTEDNLIIEIQTKNLSKLTGKIANLLQLGYKVRLVHPLPVRTYIEKYDENKNLLSRKKSPKNNDIYSLFDELMGVFPILLHKNFKLDILFIVLIEERIITDNPIQLQNKSRHRLRNWYKFGKRIESILEEQMFLNKKDYLSLFPRNLPEQFSCLELANLLENTLTIKRNKSTIKQIAYKMIWTFNKMEIIKFSEKKDRRNYYVINKKKPSK